MRDIISRSDCNAALWDAVGRDLKKLKNAVDREIKRAQQTAAPSAPGGGTAVTELPVDVWAAHILPLLQPDDLLALRKSCRQLRDVIAA
ncbi:MAG: hypothetical protein ACPGR8_16635, partial [Limisphaerales bacterium]